MKQKKKINLCLRQQILRSYRFVAEVTFNANLQLSLMKSFALKK